MAYEAVPDDVDIKKLTPAQRDALSRYRIHENINTFLANETTAPLLAGAALLVSAPTLLRLIFDALGKQKKGNGFKAPSTVEYLTFVKDFSEGFFELTGAGKEFGLSPFEGEAKDFWNKYVIK